MMLAVLRYKFVKAFTLHFLGKLTICALTMILIFLAIFKNDLEKIIRKYMSKESDRQN